MKVSLTKKKVAYFKESFTFQSNCCYIKETITLNIKLFNLKESIAIKQKGLFL